MDILDAQTVLPQVKVNLTNLGTNSTNLDLLHLSLWISPESFIEELVRESRSGQVMKRKTMMDLLSTMGVRFTQPKNRHQLPQIDENRLKEIFAGIASNPNIMKRVQSSLDLLKNINDNSIFVEDHFADHNQRESWRLKVESQETVEISDQIKKLFQEIYVDQNLLKGNKLAGIMGHIELLGRIMQDTDLKERVSSIHKKLKELYCNPDGIPKYGALTLDEKKSVGESFLSAINDLFRLLSGKEVKTEQIPAAA